MNVKILEKYFKTENEHWNDFAFQLLCDVLKLENFEHPEVALKMYSKGIDIVMEQHQTPLQAVTNVEKLLDKASLEPSQKLYIINKIYNYLIKTEFDDVFPYKVEQLLESYQKRLYREVHDVKADLNEKKVLVADIRTSLKEVMEKGDEVDLSEIGRSL